MDTFLGIPINKKLTDSEFVEKQRKHLATSKRFAWIYLIIFIGLCFGVQMLYSVFQHFIERQPDDTQKLAWTGFGLGLVLGFAIMSALFKAVESIMSGFNLWDFNRSNQLLIKYHDILMQVAKERT